MGYVSIELFSLNKESSCYTEESMYLLMFILAVVCCSNMLIKSYAYKKTNSGAFPKNEPNI